MLTINFCHYSNLYYMTWFSDNNITDIPKPIVNIFNTLHTDVSLGYHVFFNQENYFKIRDIFTIKFNNKIKINVYE